MQGIRPQTPKSANHVLFCLPFFSTVFSATATSLNVPSCKPLFTWFISRRTLSTLPRVLFLVLSDVASVGPGPQEHTQPKYGFWEGSSSPRPHNQACALHSHPAHLFTYDIYSKSQTVSDITYGPKQVAGYYQMLMLKTYM